MKMIFNDEKLFSVYKLVREFVEARCTTKEQMRAFCDSYGIISRVNTAKLRARIRSFLEDYNITLSKDIHHENGIGNNNKTAIYIENGNELIHAGYINSDLSGNAYIYFENFKGNLRGIGLKISWLGWSIC